MSKQKPIASPEEKKQKSPKQWSASQVVVGVAAASGTALLAVSLVGVTPTIIAGAAGYIAYCGMIGEET